MINKLVARVLLVVAALCIAAVVVFALVASYTPALTGSSQAQQDEQVEFIPAQGISAVPHPVDIPRFENCGNCHALGASRAMPLNHATFGNETCSLCHAYPAPTPATTQADRARLAVVNQIRLTDLH